MFDYRHIDVDASVVQDRISAELGRPASEIEVVLWLRRFGFVRRGDGWQGDSVSLRQLTDLLAGHRSVHQDA